MFTNVNRPGQNPFEAKKLRVVNRGGTTALVVGDVMALDLDASDAATQAFSGVGGVTLTNTQEACFHNIVDVGAEPLTGLVCVVTDLLSGAGADNTEVEVQISGVVKAKVGGTDWSTTLASNGVHVMADTAGSQIRRMILATAIVVQGINGRIIENIATDLSAANTTADIILFGWGSSVGSLGETD